MSDEQFEVSVNDGNFKHEVLEETRAVLVDFWAEWCPPCRMIAPIVEEIAVEYKDRVKVCKVNVDEAPSSAADYGIMSIPTLIIFKDGEAVDKIIGAVPKASLVAKLSVHI